MPAPAAGHADDKTDTLGPMLHRHGQTVCREAPSSHAQPSDAAATRGAGAADGPCEHRNSRLSTGCAIA